MVAEAKILTADALFEKGKPRAARKIKGNEERANGK